MGSTIGIIRQSRKLFADNAQSNNTMTYDKPIPINYSDTQLRILVEEYITQQRSTFTLKGACSYVLYWAMESGHTTGVPGQIYDSDQLQVEDCDRVRSILEKIVREGRIAATAEGYEKMLN